MIPRLEFGSTGHASTRLIFGAAALARATPEEAREALQILLRAGINHVDVAASYGDAELRLAPWMPEHRRRFFLATKTGERGYAAARDQIRASLERLEVEQLDLIQLHNLVKEDEWEQAMGPDGALRAAVEARDEGLVRYIGVTGHGTRVAEMHLRSLAAFDFDSVLLPYNPSMMRQAPYAADFERLLSVCVERGVAVQTIKSVARRRWPEGTRPDYTTWYEPLRAEPEIEAAVHWALDRPGIFVNSASDLRLLRAMIAAVESWRPGAGGDSLESVVAAIDTEPLFIRGYAESV